MKSVESLDVQRAIEKLRNYCVYQERCHKEVRSKLLELGMRGEQLEFVIGELISNNFLNEERFARVYAGGKFRIKKWGKRKILMELKIRNISAYCIKKAMLEIPDEDYASTLANVIEKKMSSYTNRSMATKSKLIKYLYNRGFETDLIYVAIARYFTS